jgi:hypothetical protein
MSLGSLQIGTALGILFKTTPILLIRLGVYLAFWVILLIYLGILFGVGYLLSQLWAPLGIILGLIAFGSTFFIYRLAYRYVFYLLKAAHLAIAAELLHSGSLPPGVSQLAWGREQVTSRFGQVSVMWVVDELVAGIVRSITRTVVRIANMLPGNTLRNLARVIMRVIEFATNYVDEAIMARAFWRRDENVWQSAEEGIILYGMVWKPLLVNAIALMLLSYVPFVLTIVVLAAPIGFLLGMISPAVGAWSIIFVLILSYFVKVAVGDSFAMIAMVATYQRETAGLQPDPAMEARIAGISDKFRDLKDRAMSASPFGGNSAEDSWVSGGYGDGFDDAPPAGGQQAPPQQAPPQQAPPQTSAPQPGPHDMPQSAPRRSNPLQGGNRPPQPPPQQPRPQQGPPQQRPPQERPPQERPPQQGQPWPQDPPPQRSPGQRPPQQRPQQRPPQQRPADDEG